MRSTPLLIAMIGVIATPLRSQAPDSSAVVHDASRCRWLLFPSLGAAPETGLQFGSGLLTVCESRTDPETTRPSSLNASALGTLKQQARVSIRLERWAANNARMTTSSLIWQTFPLPYFGIGDGTPESARELYNPRGVEASVEGQQRFARGWYVGGGLRHVARRISTDSSGVLRQARILGTADGPISELLVSLQRDTRDNIFATERGVWVRLNYARSVQGIVSDYSYGRLRADGRLFRTISGRHVVALHAQIVGIHGAVPFDQMPLVGGSEILRGYELGRYRDRWLAAAQGEYRTPFVRRIGAVAFAGAGLVAPSFDALASQRFLPTYGVGLRGQLDARKRTAIRADFGWGRPGSSGLYLGLNQAF